MKLPPVFGIAEKPSQLRAYASAFSAKKIDDFYIVQPCSTFPQGIILMSGLGHCLEIRRPELNSGFEHLKEWRIEDLPFKIPKPYKYDPSETGAKILKNVKPVIRQIIDQHGINNVTAICCTDIDVEGSSIFNNMLKFCISDEEYRQITIKRLWINSLESSAVFKGFNNLQDNKKDYNMYIQGITRAAADWHVGLATTRVLTIYVQSMLELLLKQRAGNSGPTLTAKDILGKTAVRSGRIILPVLHMVYNRVNTIENFESEDFYEIYADFQANSGSYRGKLEGFKTFLRKDVEDVLSRHSLNHKGQYTGQVTSVQKENKKTASPKLHSLSTIQSWANKKWKITAKSTLKICQNLYENHKLLTYPRSDCQFITKFEFDYLLENLDAYKAGIDVQFENVHTEPRTRYVDGNRVVEHFAIIPTRNIPSQEDLQKLTPNEYKIYMEVMRTTLAMFAPDYEYEKTTIITNLNGLDFKTVGNTEKNLGFKTLWANDDAPTDEKVKGSHDEDSDSNLQLPPIHEHENCSGIVDVKKGSTKPPSLYTEATLLDAMETAGKFVEDEEDASILKEVEGIGTVATRADAIESLKEASYIVVEKNRLNLTAKAYIACKATEGTLLSSPTMTAKWEKYLKQIGEGIKPPEPFLESIDKFIEKFIKTIPDVISRQDTVEFFNQLIDNVQESNQSQICPKCKEGFIKAINTSNGLFYGCSNFRNEQIKCNFNLPSIYSHKKLSAANIKALLTKGKTPPLKLKNKNGQEYLARVVLNTTTFKLTHEFADKQKSKATK